MNMQIFFKKNVVCFQVVTRQKKYFQKLYLRAWYTKNKKTFSENAGLKNNILKIKSKIEKNFYI
jgi:hypothetical protein